jgi:hypothetical protein
MSAALADDSRQRRRCRCFLPSSQRANVFEQRRQANHARPSRDTAFTLTGNQERVVKVDRMEVTEAKALLDKRLPNDSLHTGGEQAC